MNCRNGHTCSYISWTGTVPLCHTFFDKTWEAWYPGMVQLECDRVVPTLAWLVLNKTEAFFGEACNCILLKGQENFLSSNLMCIMVLLQRALSLDLIACVRC